MTLKILSEYAATAEQQARILDVLAETMQVRWFHFDQIGRDSLAAAGIELEDAAVA